MAAQEILGSLLDLSTVICFALPLCPLLYYVFRALVSHKMDVKILHNAHRLTRRRMIAVGKRSIMPGANRTMKKKVRQENGEGEAFASALRST